jgi:hypothetical protein
MASLRVHFLARLASQMGSAAKTHLAAERLLFSCYVLKGERERERGGLLQSRPIKQHLK